MTRRATQRFGAVSLVALSMLGACTSTNENKGDLPGTGVVGGSAGLGAGGGAGRSSSAGGTGATGGSAGSVANVGGMLGSGGAGAASGSGGSGAGTGAGGNGATGGAETGGSSGTGGGAGAGAGVGGSAGGAAAAGGTAGTGGSAGMPQGGAGAGGSSGMPAAGGMGGSAGASTGAPSVRIVGRTVASTNGVRFAWPGVSFTARFTGTQASINLNDGGNKNRFTVVVDNGTPSTLTTASGTTKYVLATGLANGDHQVVVWRNTESYGGVTEFVSISDFGTGGALLAPPAAPAHRIEVVGDSISCGAGVEGTNTTCTTDNFTNNYLAYGSIAARTLGVDLFTIAYSGIGMYRSYNSGGTPPPVMADRYDHAITNDSTAWDFSKYTPEVVAINLGTNDFSSGDPGQPYIDKYVSFIAHVRSKYAAAKIICVIQYSNLATAINSVVTQVKNGGDMNVESFDFSSSSNSNACASHPDKAGQAAMGAALASHIKSVMGW